MTKRNTIKKINAREILASGGYPSLEAEVVLNSGVIGQASVSFGASAGSKEAFVLFDGDAQRFNGQGMLKAVANVNKKISPLLLGKDPLEQKQIDELMIEADGTPDKSSLGANAILGVSMAVARAAARNENLPLYKYLADRYKLKNKNSNLPRPMAVTIEGGEHADNSTDLQEYLITVTKDKGPSENIRAVIEIYAALKKILKLNGFSTNVGNEGAFAPAGIKDNEKPLKFITQAIEEAGYRPGQEIGIAVDAAASEFYKNGKYELKTENKILSAEALIGRYADWFAKYPFVALEDGLSEFDWENWPKLVSRAGKVKIVGDDLVVTNAELIQKALATHSINAAIIKLNQAGTLTETIAAALLCKDSGVITIPSNRGGGETNDTFLVDLAVALGSEYIKVGPTRGERVVKYNRLMEIEKELQ